MVINDALQENKMKSLLSEGDSDVGHIVMLVIL